MIDQNKYEINQATIDKADSCSKEHRCLACEEGTLCHITSAPMGEVLFIECKEDSICSYQMSFGDGMVCTCPVRKEIYKKYEK